MNKAKEAVRRLDALSEKDPERAHAEADEILLGLIDPDVRRAYERLMRRCEWWAGA